MKALRAKASFAAGLAAIASIAAGAASAGLAVQDMYHVTVSQLVKSLVGCGVAVSDVRFIGDLTSAGLFYGGAGIIGGPDFDGGVILSSGTAASVIGPNKSDGTSDALIPDRTDSDLETLSGQDTHNASILEIEFTPSSTYITFDYVFGSEEYNEYVFSFNDVFAFFLNGENVALIPGTTTPVSINTVNKVVNPLYFINNYPSDGTPPYNTEMDGFTEVLTVTAEVRANIRNRIKLAIADGGDSLLNSWVLIRAGSFASRCQPKTLLSMESIGPGMTVAPNPFRPGSGGAQDSAAVTFTSVPAGGTIRIYTVVGRLVAEETDSDMNGLVSWNGRNRGGKIVTSGAYIWVAKARDGTVIRGKLVVIR